MDQRKQIDIAPYFLQIMQLLGVVLLFLIFKPYIAIFLLSFILAIISRPMFMRILRWTGHKNVIASLLATAVVVIIILIPMVIFADLLFRELTSAISSQSPLVQIKNFHLPDYLLRLNFDFKAYLRGVANDILSNVGLLFSNIASFLIYVILAVITLVYLFKDGHKISRALLQIIPLTDVQKTKLSDDIVAGVRAVIGGYVLVSVIQGITSGFGYWLFGIPNPVLWGFIALFVALLPTVGTALVTIPLAIFLFFEHKIGNALGLLSWYVVSISIIDNYIGPRFISGRVKIHSLLILFSILGGLKFFGPMGFLIGPLVLIFFWSLLEMSQEQSAAAETASASQKLS